MNELKISIEISDNVRSLGYALVNDILYPSRAEQMLNEVKHELLGTAEVLRTDYQGKDTNKISRSFIDDPKPEAEEVVEESEPVVEEETKPVEEAPWVTMEDVRALVVKSKANKEKAKTVMTGMGVNKLTDLDDGQLMELFVALEEGA